MRVNKRRRSVVVLAGRLALFNGSQPGRFLSLATFRSHQTETEAWRAAQADVNVMKPDETIEEIDPVVNNPHSDRRRRALTMSLLWALTAAVFAPAAHAALDQRHSPWDALRSLLSHRACNRLDAATGKLASPRQFDRALNGAR